VKSVGGAAIHEARADLASFWYRDDKLFIATMR
jgi:hypothetical protein